MREREYLIQFDGLGAWTAKAETLEDALDQIRALIIETVDRHIKEEDYSYAVEDVITEEIYGYYSEGSSWRIIE